MYGLASLFIEQTYELNEREYDPLEEIPFKSLISLVSLTHSAISCIVGQSLHRSWSVQRSHLRCIGDLGPE